MTAATRLAAALAAMTGLSQFHRAALGVVRILREAAGTPLETLTIREGLTDAVARLAEQGIDVAPDAVDSALDFTIGRFAQLLRDEGTSADLVAAILERVRRTWRQGR